MAVKTALVTGGSRGIGRAIVLALVEAGWQVAASYRQDAPSMQAVVSQAAELGGRVVPIQADLSLSADRQRLVSETLQAFERIDLLVNNAGMAPRQRQDLLEMTEASYDEVMAVNLKGPFFLTQLVARQMIIQPKSDDAVQPKIINIGSLSAYTPSVNRGEYCLSKAGMSMMTALYASRLAAAGILVYEIRAGIIETDMTAVVHEKYNQMIAGGMLPIARWGQPDDIARLAAALAEGLLPYSTGEVINVDGGFHLRRL